MKKNPIKQGKLVRPFSAKEEEEEKKQGFPGLEISGNKVKKGHKLPEKYQVSKPLQRQGSPPPVQQNQQNLKLNTFSNFTQADNDNVNKFETYMQVKMVNPDTKQVYKDVPKNSEEFKKVTSKPFNTSKTKFSSNDGSGAKDKEKQKLINDNNSIVSEGSTYLSSNKTTQNQKQQYQQQQQQQQPQGNQANYRGLSQDLDGFEQQLSLTAALEDQSMPDQQQKKKQEYSKPIKLSELAITQKSSQKNQKKQQNQQQQQQLESEYQNNNNSNILDDLFDNTQWKIVEPAGQANLRKILDQRKQKLEEYSEYVNKVKKDKNLDKKFDQMVEYAVVKLKQEDRSELSESMKNSKMFDINDFQKEQGDMVELDMELADQEVQEQKQKWKKLNQMMEDSIDSLSQMSREEIKNRHLFITDIGRQSGIQKKKEEMKQEEDQSVMEQEDDDEEERQYQSSILKFKKEKKDDKFIQRNKIQAWMKYDEILQYQSICETLPEEAKERLNVLLEDIEQFNDEGYDQNKLLQEKNPFKPQLLNEEDQKEERLQQLMQELNEEDVNLDQGILDENVLPKDKALKDEAEERILKQKTDYINQQLMKLAQQEKSSSQVTEKQIDKMKVKGLCEKLKETYEYQPSNFFIVRRREFEDMREQNLQMMDKLEELKDQSSILQTLKDVREHIQKNLIKVQKGEIQEEKTSEEEEKIFEVQNLQSQYHNITDMFKNIQNEEAELLKKYQKWEEEMKMLEEMSKPLKINSESMQNQNNQEIDLENLRKSFVVEKSQIDEIDKQIIEKLKIQQPDLFDDYENLLNEANEQQQSQIITNKSNDLQQNRDNDDLTDQDENNQENDQENQQ